MEYIVKNQVTLMKVSKQNMNYDFLDIRFFEDLFDQRSELKGTISCCDHFDLIAKLKIFAISAILMIFFSTWKKLFLHGKIMPSTFSS